MTIKKWIRVGVFAVPLLLPGMVLAQQAAGAGSQQGTGSMNPPPDTSGQQQQQPQPGTTDTSRGTLEKAPEQQNPPAPGETQEDKSKKRSGSSSDTNRQY